MEGASVHGLRIPRLGGRNESLRLNSQRKDKYQEA